MIESDLLRQILLGATGATFVGFALWAIAAPAAMAKPMGYALDNNNARSEFAAIYVGVFVAQALLCLLAALRVSDAVLGDLVAVFLLAQPVGRLIAGMRGAFPTGVLRGLFVLEVVGGVVLLLVRPG